MPRLTFDDHVRRGHAITFGVLAFFSFVEMLQTAVLVGSYNRHHDYPSDSIRDRTRFLLFVALWTIFFSIFYIIGFLRSASSFLFSIASHGLWVFITWVFWLAGAAALTDTLGGGLDCGAMKGFAHCNQLNAAEAFAWINWIIMTFVLTIIVIVGAKSARRGDGFGGPISDV
ncbi:hypothetical protein T439DRAFT_306502 [Meredithblackwellia eburnea MCA 4105]